MKLYRLVHAFNLKLQECFCSHWRMKRKKKSCLSQSGLLEFRASSMSSQKRLEQLAFFNRLWRHFSEQLRPEGGRGTLCLVPCQRVAHCARHKEEDGKNRGERADCRRMREMPSPSSSVATMAGGRISHCFATFYQISYDDDD